MKVLVIASSKEELKAFSDDKYIKCETGIGLTLAAVAATVAIERYKPDIVINVGTSGAMRRDLKIGEILQFSSVSNKDQDLTKYRMPKYATLKKDGSTLGEIRLLGDTGLKLISSSTFSDTIIDGYDAADMEAYSVAYASLNFNIPAASFKLITDYVGEKEYIADYKRILREGRKELENKVSEFLSTI